MYVCICRGFNDDKVEEALSKLPCASLKEVYKACAKGAKPQCGKCLPQIEDIKNAKAACPGK